MAAFLRDVMEATTRQQSTVESQTASGFALWLTDLPERPGIRSPYMDRPTEVPTSVLEIQPPRDPEPTAPRHLSQRDLEGLTAAKRRAYDEELRRFEEQRAQWLAHKELYDDLFAARTPAEDMELVFAVGLMARRVGGEVIRRHVVTTAVDVELDRSSQTLRVQISDAPRLELNWLDAATRSTLGDAAQSLRDLQESQSLGDAEQATRRVRASFGTHGVELIEPKMTPPNDQVGIGVLPALLLRKRDSSYVLQLLRDMADDMATGGFVSDPFEMLVSSSFSPDPRPVLSERAALPLAANEEQRLMIDNARREAHLVIQGPPGTGKTHTIANLAAVLMAEGRRVLVTAETERALTEVQAKLPTDMQPLMLPMLKERGTGALQASVNALTAEASATTTPEVRTQREDEALEHLELIEQQIAAAQEQLRTIAHEDRRPRTFGGLTMPVDGHLIALGERAAELELVRRYLSADGAVSADDARDVLELRTTVAEEHQDLARHRFPDGLMEPAEFAAWLDEHRSQLALLGDPDEFDHAPLADSIPALTRLATRLQRVPPAPWTSLTRTTEEYTAAAQRAAAAAARLDHGVALDPPHATTEALRLCEEYLALDERRFDEPVVRLLDRHAQAIAHAARSTVHGEFDWQPRAEEFTRVCEEALDLLRRDLSGLLARHVQDHRVHGHSSVDALVNEASSLVEGSRDSIGLDVTIESGAPAVHELAVQAEQLSAHLAGGGRMTGLLRTPKAVRDAEELIRYVRVGGSAIDTLGEAERARDHLRFRARLATIDAWAAGHGLTRPDDISHHDWLTAIVAVPAASEQIRAACKLADELVRFPFGSAPDDPSAFLTAALATISKDTVSALEGLAEAGRCAPRLLVGGHAVASRDEAERARRALDAILERQACHALLPPEWQQRCNALDGRDDLLAEMLEIAAAAAAIPGPARTSELTPSAVTSIAERVERDCRRARLLAEHDRVIGGLRRALVGCVPQSPATQAIAAAVRDEDPIAYRRAVVALEAEIRKAAEARRFDEARAALERAHPELLQALDLDDDDAIAVLSDIRSYEQLRDHERTVRTWLDEIGSAARIHDELRRLHDDARRAEQRLASIRCWNKAVDRLQARRELRSALSALSNAMDAVPKTRTAKSYPARMRALRNATADAAPAIPCWVMTVDRVAEVLGYPDEDERFDVVIIDEASQAWFPAIFLYAIADQVIVVGDKLQTSPASTIVSVEQLAAIAREHIPGHRLEDRVGDDLSLYDVAEVMTGPDMMVDHFRCVPEIIEISNRLSYAPMGRRLQPSRVREPGALQPIIHVRVAGERLGSAANVPEVDAIVAQVVRCHSNPAYAGMTFGVVVVGPSPTAHMKLLRSRLLEQLGPQAIGERDLEVGTASQFQGAERDVMFLSLVVAPAPGERIRIWPHEHTGRNRRNVQQLNVAVSRARDQLWIFHSFDPVQLAPEDARAVLFDTSVPDPPTLDEQLRACQSQFERDVVAALAGADGHLVLRTQVEALGYSIDIVLEDEHGHRLAVECDGDRWHSSDAQIRSDLYRQRTLESIGWRFYRVLASEWYDDPERHVRAILDALARSERPAPTRRVARSNDARPSWSVASHGPDDEPAALDAEPSAHATSTRDPLRGRPARTADHQWHDGPRRRDAEVLVCERCGRSWSRPVTPGRKPTKCVDCAAGRSVRAG